MRIADRIAKRTFDLSASLLGLAVLSPLILLTSVAVRVESEGPVFFRQERLGLGGRIFRIWKFRTMRADASVEVSGDGSVVNNADDTRHTRVGRWLRRLSLDEIPQLLNVVTGEMSLVGPRPDLPEAIAFYTETDRAKLSVRPGITGLAQVSGRNALSPREKWRLDLEYAQGATFFADLAILARTMRLVLARSDVYSRRRP